MRPTVIIQINVGMRDVIEDLIRKKKLQQEVFIPKDCHSNGAKLGLMMTNLSGLEKGWSLTRFSMDLIRL